MKEMLEGRQEEMGRDYILAGLLGPDFAYDRCEIHRPCQAVRRHGRCASKA